MKTLPLAISGALLLAITTLLAASPRTDNSITIFDRSHQDALGGKGEDKFRVDQPLPACGQTGKAFDHAVLVIRQQRFSSAKILSLPKSGCTRCKPIVVNWVNEPTGKLDYQLQVYWTNITRECADRGR